jgi:cytochrome c-type biogenesis protein CcmE
LKAQAKFIIGAGVILVTLGWLGWVGATESQTYYHTVSELSSLKGSELHQRMRISGYVQKGSIHRLSNETDFTLEQGGKLLTVSYVGSDPLPDTFKGGAQAMVQGRLGSGGRFVAQQVQAKCASHYAASTTPLRSIPSEPGSTASDVQEPVTASH